MHRNPRVVLLTLIVVATAYVLLFVPPNLTGARDANMLATFQVDEWIQYPFLMQMTTPGATARATLTNILVYGHYYYGYPFYLTSALAILPLRAAAGFAPLEADAAGTTANLLVLRQLSPLFMVVAVLLLLYCWTGFEHLGRSLLALLLLLTAPAVFDNNLWWHPESLTLLFVALTIFALYRDDLRFGRWFIVAAVACGLAAGTKQAGFWFFLTIAVYLALRWRADGLRPTLKRGLVFAGVMALTIVVSNPMLLVPSIGREIVQTQMFQAQRIAFGWDVSLSRGPVPWYQETLRITYGYWWIYGLALVACVWVVLDGGKRRLLAMITLTSVVPLAVYLLFFVAAKPSRYFLPVMIPMLATLSYEGLYRWERHRPARIGLSLVIIAAILFQSTIFLRRDITMYNATLHRETLSPALHFHHEVVRTYLDQLPPGTKVTIYRDPSVYVAPREDATIVMNWELPSHSLMARLNPDLILLQRYNIDRFADPAFVTNNLDPEHARLNAEFYAQAAADTLPNYRRLLMTDFGLALIRR